MKKRKLGLVESKNGCVDCWYRGGFRCHTTGAHAFCGTDSILVLKPVKEMI